MPATIHYESGNLCVLQVKGRLQRAMFNAGQESIARKIEAGIEPRVLAVLEEFEGWERGADWDDFEFQLTHGQHISKIAVVADPQWEADALAFAGAGFRRTVVKFFLPWQLTDARAWLS